MAKPIRLSWWRDYDDESEEHESIEAAVRAAFERDQQSDSYPFEIRRGRELLFDRVGLEREWVARGLRAPAPGPRSYTDAEKAQILGAAAHARQGLIEAALPLARAIGDEQEIANLEWLREQEGEAPR